MVPVDVRSEELHHHDELVQKRLESVDVGRVNEESELGIASDSLRLVLLVGLPRELVVRPESLPEVGPSSVVVDAPEEVGISLVVVAVVVAEVGSVDRLLSGEEESNSSVVDTLDRAVESSLLEVAS